MTSAQSRIAETIEVFYGAADHSSDGAMAGHAYKRSVDELDAGFGRELVLFSPYFNPPQDSLSLGYSLPHDNFRAPRKDVCILPRCE